MRRVLLALICLAGLSGDAKAQEPPDLVACKSAPSQQPKPDSRNYAAHIRETIEKVNLPACGRVFANKSASREDRIAALHRRANYLAHLGRFDRARLDVNELLKLDPKRAETHVLRASLLRRQKRSADALASLDRSIKTLPREHSLYIERGRLHESSRRLDEAAGDFSKALEVADTALEQAESRMARGRIFSRTGKLKEAVEDYSAAIALDPRPEELGFAYTNRAEALLYLKERDRAAEDLQKMLSVTADDHPARPLANILMENIERQNRESPEDVDGKR